MAKAGTYLRKEQGTIAARTRKKTSFIHHTSSSDDQLYPDCETSVVTENSGVEAS